MKYFLSVLICIFWLSSGTAQTKFATPGATWSYFFYSDDHISHTIRYSSEKDTMYEGISCAKVSGIKTMKTGGMSTLNPTYFYTSGDTVFYYHDSFKIFTPIYIFNVNAGDTITLLKPTRLLMAGKSTTFKMVIDRVETNVADGVSLRTVFTNPLPAEITWLRKYTERFGGLSVAHILAVDDVKTGDHTEGLRCYSDSEIVENLSTDGFGCDYIPTSINEQIVKQEVKIYPNPASVNELYLETPGQNGPLEIIIHTIDSKIVSRYSLSGNSASIDISKLSPGIFFIRFASDAGVYTQKLIVE